MADQGGRKRNFVRMAPGQTLDGCSRVILGDSVLDLDTLEMTRSGESVTLRPLPLRLLLFLLRNRNRTVSREEILESLWSSAKVSDYAFSSALRDLRRALGDSGAAQGAIRTLRNRGYRYVGTVLLEGMSEEEGGRRAPSTQSLFGREPELRVMRTILEESLRGAANLVLLDGVPGIGKTALLEHFLSGLDDSLPVVHAACMDSEWTPPGALLELLVGPSSGESFEPTELVSRLKQIAARGSFVVGIDDIDRADHFSLVALRDLSMSGKLRRCLIIATRSTDPEQDPEFERFIRDMPLRRMHLGGLDSLAIQRLARELGLPPVDPAAVEALRSRVDGHPVLARALLHRAFAELGRTPEPREITEMPIPEEARKVLRRRVERCTRAARRALVLMAQSDRADIPSLASAAQLPSERLRPLVDELRRAGLVTELEDGSFVLENPILYEEVSNGEIFNSGS